ncbi:hypothetical protein CRUP_021390 [Coryphaenoides rupestris]|nr:hypothetical protein CRUP_021390 [Coryphaenoides rupestris]
MSYLMKMRAGINYMMKMRAVMSYLMKMRAGINYMMKMRAGINYLMRMRAVMNYLMKMRAGINDMMKMRVVMSYLMKMRAGINYMMKMRAVMSYLMKMRAGINYMMKVRAGINYLMKMKAGINYMMKMRAGINYLMKMRAASRDMDVLLTSAKVVCEEQPELEESGGKGEEEEEEEEELGDKVKSAPSPPDENDLCSICGFVAKCPRALKIHVTRKHRKKSRRRSTKSDQDGEAAPHTAAAPGPVHQESAPGGENGKDDPNPADDEVKSVAKDHGIYARGSVQTDKGEAVEPAPPPEDSEGPTQQRGPSAGPAPEHAEGPAPERRLSKRTPKPKVIHSCNYCGQEFFDKALLEVHVKRTHAKDTPYTFDAEENMEEEEEEEEEEEDDDDDDQEEAVATETASSTLADLPLRAVPKHTLSRFLLKCGSCEFRVSSPALLESHTRVKHPSPEWYRCKPCHYFAASAEWMRAHLSSEGHKAGGEHREGDADASKAGAIFEECVEKVSRDGALANDGAQQGSDGEGPALPEGHRQAEEAVEAARLELAEGEKVVDEPQPTTSSTTCTYCGLVVSNATNLSVHVRRKHSKEYGYNCTLCNYSCVTKGDMDRHCITKKHVRRVQESAEKKQEQEPVVISHQRAEESSQDSDGEPAPTDSEDHEHSDTPSQKRSKYDSGRASTEKPAEDSTEIEDSSTAAADDEDQTQTEEVNQSEPGCMDHGASGDGPSPSNQTITPASQEMPAELPNISELPISDPQEEPDSQEQESENMETDTLDIDAEVMDDKEDNSVTDTQMSRALPFDACIVSIKSLAGQEKVLGRGLSQEGEAAVVCLTGGGTSLFPTFPTSPGPASSHVKKIRPKPRMKCEGQAARIRCDDCGFMADGLSGLNVHISMKHPTKERHFHCMVCGKSFYTDSNLHQHLTSAAHLRNEQNSVEELPEGGATFKCVKCTERFDTEQELFVHIKEKHEELLREVNKYVLEDTAQINREREENQGSVCKFCGKVCKSSNSMAFLAHVRTHTGSKPFKCKICNFATAQLGDARNHVKRHLGMREYKCDICGVGVGVVAPGGPLGLCAVQGSDK